MAKKSGERGVSLIEFTLLAVVWVPLLLGTFAIGTTMVKALQTIQIARDAASLASRGVDFSYPANQAMLARLGQDMGLTTTGGTGVVILSEITYIGKYQCLALNLVVDPTANPPVPTTACTNYQHFVFARRLVVGNAAVRNSAFGDPAAGLADATTGTIALTDQVKTSGARADQFALLPKPVEDGSDGFQAGQTAYLAEAAFQAPGVPGTMADTTTYSAAVF